MSFDVETPSGAMYGAFKQFGGISNKDLARALFADSFSYGGIPIAHRLEERSFLTRNIVHVSPGTFGESAFRDFSQTAQQLCSLMQVRYPGDAGKYAIIAFFAGEGCDRMSVALQQYEQNAALFRNSIGHLASTETSRLSDKAALLVLQFITAGCLGNISRATEITMQYASAISHDPSATIARTSFTTLVEDVSAGTQSMLGLCKMVNGVPRMPPYVLSTDPAGTEIGSLTTAQNAINDVDSTVSRRHVHIFRDSLGNWYAQGLGSTNGTTLVRAQDQSRVVVEPPRSQRIPGEVYPPVQIYPHDILRLAGTTSFTVVELAL